MQSLFSLNKFYTFAVYINSEKTFMLKINLPLLFILSLLNIGFLSAQSLKIQGTVYNENNEPLVSVTVRASNNAVFTDVNGHYIMTNVPKSNKPTRVIFSLLGYQTVECVFPNMKKDIVLDIVMTEDAKVLDAVTVEGKASRTINMTDDIFDPNRKAYVLNSNVESLLATQMGVSSTNELSSQYQVRGGNFDENIIYVNGIEIYRPLLVRSAQQEGLSFINSNMIQNLAFSTGGYNAEYGDKMSSVLDIKYKRPSKFEASVGGSLMDGNLYVGNNTGRFSQMTSLRYKTNKSLLSTTDTKAEYNPEFWDAQSYMRYDLSSKWNINFLGNYSYNKYQFTPISRTTTFGTLSQLQNFKVNFNGWENDLFITYLAALTLKGNVSDKVELGLSASVFSSNEQERYDIEGKYRLTEAGMDANNSSNTNDGALLGVGSYMEHARNKLDADILNVSHTGRFNIDRHQIKWGIQAQHEKIKDKIKEWEMRDSAGYSLPNNGNVVSLYSTLRADNKINSNRLSAYLQDKYMWNTKAGLLSLTLGLRGSYWSFNKEFLFSPRASIIFIPESHDNWTMRFATGLYYQSPFYKEYQQIVNTNYNNNTIVLNENIKSQKSIHFVLGSDYEFKIDGRLFKLTNELYYKKLSDVIPYTVNGVKIRYSGINEGTGYIAGFDTRLYGEFVPGTTSWISFSLMKTQQNIAGVKVPLPTDQRYNISIFFQDYFPSYKRLKMYLKGSLSQGLPVSAPYKGFEDGYFRTPAYKRVDLGFSWEVLGTNYSIRSRSSFCKAFKNVWLGMDVFNIFDIKNVNTYYWITDVYNRQYAVPNYLTGRQLNFRVLADF